MARMIILEYRFKLASYHKWIPLGSMGSKTLEGPTCYIGCNGKRYFQGAAGMAM